MRYRRLGRTNIGVSEIGYGAWGIGGTLWVGANDRESRLALRTAIDKGVNFIDTALVYGNGHSEQLVGEAVRESRNPVFVATKIPPKNRLWPAREGIGIAEVFPGDYMKRCTEESLRNLGTDTIDVQQLHVWNAAWTDSDEWRRAIEDLRTSGKVKAFGISVTDYDADSALSVIATGLVDTVQVIYNIFDPRAAVKLFPACVAQNIGVIVRVPFDEGALAGKITARTTFPDGDFRNHYFRGDRKKEVEEHVHALLRDLSLTELWQLPEVAMRFCLSDPAVSTVVAGMRTVESVEGNVRASAQGPLPVAVLEVLRRHTWVRNFYD